MKQFLAAKIRNGVKKAFQSVGYDITPYPKLSGPYEKIIAKSYYAPWKEDAEFAKAYGLAQSHTLVDRHRCYELWSLVEQSAKVPGALMEIGVWRGGTGGLIATRASQLGIQEPVYLCDTFEGVVKTSSKDLHYFGKEHNDTSLEIARCHIEKNLNLTNVRFLKGIFPDQTAHLVESSSFRFCHVDVDVYDSTRDILDWLWPRLNVGGMVVFDDYGFPTCTGIRDYVNERKNLQDRIFIHNINGHAIWIKR